MRPKIKTIRFVLTVMAVLLVCFIITISFIDLEKYKPIIEKSASEALGMRVRIEGVLRVSFFPSIGISLDRVSVENRGLDLVSAKKVRVGLELIPLLRNDVRIRELKFISPRIIIERDSSGRFNFEKPAQTTSEKNRASGGITRLSRAGISGGELIYTDKKSGIKIDIKDIDLTISDLSMGESGGKDLARDISFEGSFRCRELDAGRFRVSDIVVPLKAEGGIFDMNPVTLRSFGKKEKGDLRIDMTRDVSVVTAHYSASGYDLGRFSDMVLKGKFMGGDAGISLSLSAQGKSLAEMKRKMKGDVSLKGEDLQLYSYDLDSLLSKIEESQNFSLIDAGAFLFAGPLGTVLTKGYNFAGVYKESRGGKGSIKKLVSAWKITNSVAEAEDVALSTKKNRIALKGRVDLVNERFDDITIAALDKKGCVRFSQKMSGPFNDPRIEKVSMLRSIAGPALSFFEKTKRFLSGGKCEVFYAGSVSHPE
jgi:uncharacterized protein involved in outer membrane biogenesis